MESPDGGIGRRAGFKIQFLQGSVGSIPTPGTKEPPNWLSVRRFLFLKKRVTRKFINFHSYLYNTILDFYL